MSEQRSWIKIGPHGTFARSGAIYSTPQDIDERLGPALANNERLLVHVHGGLVSESSGLAIADAMATHYGDAACSLSLVWETGVQAAYRVS
jgi:hypothetical protein